ncbi:MAG: hypothetical protein JSV26_10155 [bacterium]|nr:MAG: hypothetical protein JSV26_10155 [bacterium]
MKSILPIVLVCSALAVLGLLVLQISYRFFTGRVVAMWSSDPGRASERDRFSRALVQGLPEPAVRFFTHAVPEGSPLYSRGVFTIRGAVRVTPKAQWSALNAREVLNPGRGFVWTARVGRFPLVLNGADCYFRGRGMVRFSLFGLLPVIRQSGADVSRSSLGRLALESFLWVPTVFVGRDDIAWVQTGEDSFALRWVQEGEDIRLRVHVDGGGAVESLWLDRYGNQTDDGRFDYIPFGVRVHEEGFLGGMRIPVRLSAGWWFGTERYFESVRIEVRNAEFR